MSNDRLTAYIVEGVAGPGISSKRYTILVKPKETGSHSDNHEIYKNSALFLSLGAVLLFPDRMFEKQPHGSDVSRNIIYSYTGLLQDLGIELPHPYVDQIHVAVRIFSKKNKSTYLLIPDYDGVTATFFFKEKGSFVRRY